MTMDPLAFRQAMSRFAAGVTVVTTLDDDGTPWGFTASSFASVSLHPPLVLVCLAYDADSAPAFEACERFAVNIIGEHDCALGLRFASRGVDKFAGASFVPGEFGQPTLPSSIATVECDVEHRYEGGDHMILVGRVRAARATDEEPIVYFDRGFRHLGESIAD